MLKAIFRILKILFVLFFVLPLSYCMYQMDVAEKEGKKWCAETITEFESKPYTKSNNPALGDVYMKAMSPKPKFMYDARFFGERNGKYKCTLKLSGDTIYEYSSDTKSWNISD